MNYTVHDIYGDAYSRTGHFGYTYRGINCVKCPFDYALYQMLITEIKPDLIIEIGTHVGGSTLYLADLLDINNHGVIHTIDIENKVTSPLIMNHKRIQKKFINGYEKYDIKNLENFNKILLIDDGSHDYYDIIKAYEKFEQYVNTYYIIEDGILSNILDDKIFNGGPLRAIDEIVNKGKFYVDEKFCNFYGKNYTFNPNGYLKYKG